MFDRPAVNVSALIQFVPDVAAPNDDVLIPYCCKLRVLGTEIETTLDFSDFDLDDSLRSLIKYLLPYQIIKQYYRRLKLE